ncbi:MAG: hypothetical protein [Olavius algarvensis Delta 4 endosymbiont]|nr:MAG: hypothetical protein [Olavius algarvensis Delta 4 endosymbiont]
MSLVCAFILDATAVLMGLLDKEGKEHAAPNLIVPKLCPSRSNFYKHFQTKLKIVSEMSFNPIC